MSETKELANDAAPAKVLEKDAVENTDANEGSDLLSRKRTREDFEEDDDKVKDEESKEKRPIAQLKRQRSTLEVKPVPKNDVTEKIDGPLNEVVDDLKDSDKQEEEEDTKEVTDNKSEDASQEVIKEGKPDEKTKSEESKESKESKEETKEPIVKPLETPVKSKFVFGSTTPFGANAFSILDKKKNVFESTTAATPKTATSSAGSVFGSHSKFGNAFQSAISKQSIFEKSEDKIPESKEEEDASPSKKSETPTTASASSTTSTHLYKQVELQKTDIKSGEEDEIQVFSCRAKLYSLDLTNVKDGWKEHGVGTIHVNKSQEVGKSSRVIMRSIGLLKVILNAALVSGLEVVKGMPSSLSSEKFIRITSVKDGKPVQYALKTGNVELTNSLFDEIDNLIPKTV